MTRVDLIRFLTLWDAIKDDPSLSATIVLPPATTAQRLLVARSQAARAIPVTIPDPPREVIDLQDRIKKLASERKDTGPAMRTHQATRERDLRSTISARQAKGNAS